MWNKIRSAFLQLRTIRQINRNFRGKIDSSGSSGQDPWIRLNNGKTFIGQPSPYYLRRLHFLLRNSLRKRISRDHMQVLFDINFRYMGRSNLQRNLKEGKYLELNQGNIVFEVGAYIGYHAMRLAEMVGETGRVIAIEAIPSNYQLLRKNIEINRLGNVTPVHMAIWKEQGTISFNIDEQQKNSAIDRVVNQKEKMELPCDTMDQIFLDQGLVKVDFIRIQINGAELEALEGMTEVLKHKPTLLVAVPYRNREQVQQFLEERGYAVSFTGHSLFATHT